MRLAAVMTPGKVVAASVIASAIAWLLPGESLYLRGFDARAPASPSTVLVIILWYAACLMAVGFGRFLGSTARVSKRVSDLDESPAFGRLVLTGLTIVASIGIAATYAQIAGAISISAALSSATGNALSAALDGSAGLTTLRYATTAAAALAIIRRLTGHREPVLLSFNIVLLLLSALVTSRLSLIMCAVMVAYGYSKARPSFTIRLRTIVAVGTVGFVLLAAFNFVRNANYYESFDVENPLAMNYYQVVTYLGAPMQASLATADAILQRRLETPPGAVTEDVITPSFLVQEKVSKDQATIDPNRYGQSLLPSLNTNSVFADTYVDYGPRGLAYVLLLLVGVGALFGRFSQYVGPSSLVAGTCLYGIAELWRVLLFNQGIFVFLVISQVGVLLIARTIHLSRRRASIAPTERLPAQAG